MFPPQRLRSIPAGIDRLFHGWKILRHFTEQHFPGAGQRPDQPKAHHPQLLQILTTPDCETDPSFLDVSHDGQVATPV